MNTFLPMFYNFKPENVLTPNRANLSWIARMPEWVNLVVLILGIIFVIICLFIGFSKNDLSIRIMGYMCVLALIAGGVMLSHKTKQFTTLNNSVTEPYKLNCNFKLRDNSNLIVRQVKKRHPVNANEPNGYPYRLYVKDETNGNKLIYLGQTNESGQFILTKTNNVNALFASYYNYVQKHHLNDKFTQKLLLVKDPVARDANGVPLYVLKGNDITLKIKPDKNQKYQIYTVKE